MQGGMTGWPRCFIPKGVYARAPLPCQIQERRMTTTIPPWALEHLERALPAGNPIVNAQTVRRNLVLANTRLGAVLVQKRMLAGVRLVFLEVPSQKTAFRCAKCQENLQFYNLDIPSDVYCSICAAKYHVDARGRVRDDQGRDVPAEFKPRQLDPFPPVWEMSKDARHVEDGTSGDASANGHGRGSPPTIAPYQHNGYTLYAREMATRTGKHTLFFFSKGKPRSGSPTILPKGYDVEANGRTGLPYLKKAGRVASVPRKKVAPRRKPKSRKVKSGRKRVKA